MVILRIGYFVEIELRTQDHLIGLDDSFPFDPINNSVNLCHVNTFRHFLTSCFRLMCLLGDRMNALQFDVPSEKRVTLMMYYQRKESL